MGDMVETPPVQLSTDQVMGIPKLDKGSYIASFLQDQRMHIQSDALKGHHRSIDGTSDAALRFTHSAQRNDHDIGFGTPILKHRTRFHHGLDGDTPADPAQVGKLPSKAAMKKRNLCDDKTGSKSKAKETLGQCRVGGRILRDAKAKANTKKRERTCSSDNIEHDTRLMERKERKRVKRAIVNLVQARESEDDVSDGRIQGSKGKKRQAAQTMKLPPGLALMYGFNANNIGNHRLTQFKPQINVGVFGKGKASAKTKVKRKIKKESCLLNGQGRPISGKHCQSSSPDARSEGLIQSSDPHSSPLPDSGPHLPQIVNEVAPKGLQMKENIPTGKASVICRGSGPGALGQVQAESVVWDIERDLNSIGTQEASPQPQASVTSAFQEGTVILNTGLLPFYASSSCHSSSVCHKENSVTAISLRPSESASQRVQGNSEHVKPHAASQYFSSSAKLPRYPYPPWHSLSERKPPRHFSRASIDNMADTIDFFEHSLQGQGRTMSTGNNLHEDYQLSPYIFYEDLRTLDDPPVRHDPTWAPPYHTVDEFFWRYASTHIDYTDDPATDDWRSDKISFTDESVHDAVISYDRGLSDADFLPDGYAQLSDCSMEADPCEIYIRDENSTTCDLGHLGSQRFELWASDIPESDNDETMLPMDFCQGRALLLGLSAPTPSMRNPALFDLPLAELDVAQTLKGHWRRQRL